MLAGEKRSRMTDGKLDTLLSEATMTEILAELNNRVTGTLVAAFVPPPPNAELIRIVIPPSTIIGLGLLAALKIGLEKKAERNLDFGPQ